MKNKYNVEYSSLQKGSYITVKNIEEITGVPFDDKKFGLASLNLKTEIERNLNSLGVNAVLKHENNGLLICDDEKAVQYTWNRFNSHLTGMVKQTSDMRHKVDTINFTDKEKKDYYNKLQIATEVTEGATKTKKKILGLQNNRERASIGIEYTKLNKAA